MNEEIIIDDEEEEVDKTNQALDKVIQILKEAKLRTQDLLLLYGNLGYSIGNSIEGGSSPGPDVEELQKKYHERPTVGVALMLQAVLTTSWAEQYIESTKKNN